MKTLHELITEGITPPSEGNLPDVILIEIEIEPEDPYLDVDKVIGETHEFVVQAYTYKTDRNRLSPQNESVTIAQSFTWEMDTCLDQLICFKVHRDSMAHDITCALEGLPEPFLATTGQVATEALKALEILTKAKAI